MRAVIRFLWPYARRYRRGWALGIAALVAKVGATVAVPLFIRAGVDSLFTGFALGALLTFAGLLAAIAALKGLFQYWMRIILIGISRDIEYDLRQNLLDHLVSLSRDYYSRTRTGDIMARATNDLNAVRMLLGPGFMYSAETGLTLIVALIVMLSVDWQLTLAAFLPTPLVSLSVGYFGAKIHDRFEAIQSKFSDISSRMQEHISAVRLLRAYVQEESELQRFEALNRGYVADNLALARLSAAFLPLLQALIGLTFLIVLAVGGYRVLVGGLTIGGFVMFNTYMAMLIWPMVAVGWVVNLIERGRASLGRLEEILRERPSIAGPPHPVALPSPLRGEIEFQAVTVRYGHRDALHDLNLTIRSGETVALVGRVGSGKSTVVRLIPRLEDPTRGAVLVDGIDVRRLSLADLRQSIGVVPQESFLFSATIAENIAWGVPRASDAEILRAARIAGLEPDLAAFPLGLATMVGERGLTLSGGQKQRTAIARAILRDPRILILDDALASVDTATEERILGELGAIFAGRTTLLISHRVSTIRHADRIVVLDEGRIVEQGTHAELIAAGGYYAGLNEKQMLEEELEAI